MDYATDEEHERSRQQGFVGYWSIAEGYEIRDGFLRPLGDRKREYMPAAPEHEGVLTDFARLEAGSEGAVIRFAEKWGLLGYNELMVSCGNAGGTVDGDPLPWVEAHASGVKTCMRLIEYLNQGSREGLERFLSSLPTDSRGDAEKVTLLVFHGYGPWTGTVPHTVFKDSSPEHIARVLILTIVNDNLQTIHPRLMLAEPGGKLALYHDFAALLDVIYWRLARIAVSSERLSRCAYCGQYFLRTHGRQQYCPPPEGTKSRESLCSRKARAHR